MCAGFGHERASSTRIKRQEPGVTGNGAMGSTRKPVHGVRVVVGLSAAIGLANVCLGFRVLAEESGSRTIYRRVEDNGTISFTDNPERYDAWEVFIEGKSRSGSRFLDYRKNFHRYDDVIRKLGAEHNLDPALIKAVAMAESAFNPNAFSRVGARGLMQLLPETARLVGVQNIWDPYENLEGGTRYLKQMMMRFGNRSLAVAAYNAGPRAVAKYNGIPPYPETQTYVRRVEAFYEAFRENDLSFPGW